MHRFSAILLAAALAACEGTGPPPASAPTTQARALFPRGGVADVIEVEAIDRLPLGSAELVAPDGTATAASSIDTNGDPHFTSGQWAANDPMHTELYTPNSPAVLNPRDTGAGAAFRSEGRLLAILSSASIALPDRVLYRQHWRDYRIRLGFGQPGGPLETREIAAPEPPPGL